MDHSTTSAATLAAAISDRTRDLQHRPLLTVYDDLAGARTELSYATADNWASKAANLLSEEFDLRPGDTVTLDLDGHWTTPVLTLACWKAGVAVAHHDTGAAARLACCHVSRLAAHANGPVLVVGDGLRAEPLEPVAERDGLVLLGEDVHAFADDYDDPEVDASSPALLARSGGGDLTMLDHAAVLIRATRWREALGDGARVGLATALDTAAAQVLLAGVVLAGGSLVASRPGFDAQPGRWSTERVTAVAGPAGHLVDRPGGAAAFVLDAFVG